jgi:pyridoxine 4-dehydrogenase
VAQGTTTIGGDLRVSRIGYGAMQLTGPKHWGEYPDRDGAIRLLRTVIEAGVTLIDTADVYGPHSNEMLIRDALHPYPADLTIATKGGFVRGGPEYSAIAAVGNSNYLRQSAIMSARRLGLDHIDLYYLHSVRATDVPFEDQVATLADLRKEGLIRHVGLSNVTLDQLASAREIVDIAAVTGHFNVVARRSTPTGTSAPSELMRAAIGGGAVFVPWQPVSLSTPGEPADVSGPEGARSVLAPIALRLGATVPQITLAWLLATSPSILPIPGTTSPGHLKENVAAQEINLSADDLLAIDGIAKDET